MIHASWSCFKLFKQTMAWALALARERTGRRSEARMPMIAMTTRSSIRVNPPLTPPRRGTLSAVELVVCLRTLSWIPEGGRAFGQAFPDIFPVAAAGGDEPALENSFNRHQGSRVSPPMNLSVAIGVGNHSAPGVAAGRQMRPAFPSLVAVQ